ncbi:hypothetical protein SPHINGO361_100162 [Sphingomonas sp. EC-HK361]|nr:hypothetical protein SPHINGO361_100162 [Sphingomonas sp. EC-HK361]
MAALPGFAGPGGAVAQMGERCNRTAEVRGSIPLGSTTGLQISSCHGNLTTFPRERRSCPLAKRR